MGADGDDEDCIIMPTSENCSDRFTGAKLLKKTYAQISI